MKLGHTEDANRYLRRSLGWTNLYNPAHGWLQPRNADGTWVEPFDPLPYNKQGFLESFSAVLTWFPVHDLDGMMQMMGGREKTIARLNEQFERAKPQNFRFGWLQYENNTGFHHAHLFNLLGDPVKSQRWVREVYKANYSLTTTSSDAYAHDDEDQGQMGSLSALMANHNITKLTMRGVWSRDCRGGHILKMRAFESDIQGCMFTDPNGISLNWFLDFPDGGQHKFAGNIVEHKSKNSGSVLIAYGEDGLLNPAPHKMLITQNTFINDGDGTFFKIQNVTPDVSENVFAGKNASTDAGNQTVTKQALENPAEYNFRITKPDQGITNYANFMYVQTANSVGRNDTSFGAYDPKSNN